MAVFAELLPSRTLKAPPSVSMASMAIGMMTFGSVVSVAMGVGGEVVLKEEAADLKEHGDGLAVIARYAVDEVLRRLDSAGGGFDGHAGKAGGWRPGFIADQESSGGIGREQACIGDIGGDCYGLVLCGELGEFDIFDLGGGGD